MSHGPDPAKARWLADQRNALRAILNGVANGLIMHGIREDWAPMNEFLANLPKNYNDPFELFLSVNVKDADVEDIAYYLEILGEIPQMPTSCFSKRPDVVPMWAHYGRNHAGYAIEIEEAALAGAVSLGYIENITLVAYESLDPALKRVPITRSNTGELAVKFVRHEESRTNTMLREPTRKAERTRFCGSANGMSFNQRCVSLQAVLR